jgi:ABC-type branched-subunit amino acid transport system ATPase component/branched-subunit amino acid ABC-type transport system permease component
VILAVSFPLPVVVLGVVVGMVYGILAIGLVLVYRSNQIVNFAHGEIGVLGASVLGVLVNRWHFPYWAVFPLAIAAAAGAASLSEIIVVRRLRKAPIVMSVVATLGLAEFLHNAALILNSQVQAGVAFPQPAFLPSFQFGPLLVTRAYTGMLLLSPIVVIGLAIFFRSGRLGLAIRAAASNPDAAEMAGVSARRMSTLCWAMAGGVSAFTALLWLPSSQVTNGQLLGPSLLLRALTAAVIGRMRSLPVAFIGGIGVGVLERGLQWNYRSGGQVEVALFVIVLAVLLLQPRQEGRAADRGGWALVQPWRPLPDAVRKLRSVRLLPWMLAGVFAVVAAAAGMIGSNSNDIAFAVIASYAIVGLSVGIVTGLGGELTLGQFALAGVGAVVSYVVANQSGNFLLSFTAAGLAGAAVSLVIAIPAIRIRGFMLAVATISFALAAENWLLQQSWMLGPGGIHPGRPIIGGYAFDTGRRYYFFTLVVLGIAMLFCRNVWRSGLGRAMRAVRDNESQARAFTVRATRIKIQGFMLGGFVAGLGGAAFGHIIFQLIPPAFPTSASISVTALAVIGGIGSLAGPLFGALYMIGVPKFIPLDHAGHAATALGWLALILYAPGGIAQLASPIRTLLTSRLAQRAGIDLDDVSIPTAELASFTVDAAAARPDSMTPRSKREDDATGPPVLEARRVTKAYGGIHAVDAVDLEVLRGETVGIIGPNGAGKTTLFELLSGFARLDGGEVVYDGHNVTSLPPERRAQLGLVRSFQDVSLFPTLTVVEAVMVAQERELPTSFVRSILGATNVERQKEARARELVGMMGLDVFRDKAIRELSTGTRRITELACLMALEPQVLLLDEPSSGIAQSEVEALGQLLGRLKRDLDVTLVVIEHDIPLIMSLSDRIVAMETGRILASGTPEEIRTDARVIESYLGGNVVTIERSGGAKA